MSPTSNRTVSTLCHPVVWKEFTVYKDNVNFFVRFITEVKIKCLCHSKANPESPQLKECRAQALLIPLHYLT